MHKLSEQAESLQNILVSQATGGIEDETEFTRLRKVILSQPALEIYVPRFVKTCRSLGQFWQLIKIKFGTYAERRTFNFLSVKELLLPIKLCQLQLKSSILRIFRRLGRSH